MASDSGHGCGMSVSMHCTDETIMVGLRGPVSSGSHPVELTACGQSVTLFLRLDQVQWIAHALGAYVQDQQRQAEEAAGVPECDTEQVP